MYSFTRRATLAVLLIAALLAMLGARAADITLDTAGTQSGVNFVDATANIHAFPSNGGAPSSGVAIGYTDTSVTGDTGLVIKGLASAAGVNAVSTTLDFTTTIVVDSTITVSNALPPYYAITFLGVQAQSQSAGKPVFSLSSLVMTTNNTLVIRAVSAKWSSGSAGVVVATADSAPAISTNSGLFVTSVKVDGSAASVFACSGTFRVTDSSVFAVDGAQCTGCTQPIVAHDGTVTVGTNSIYRVSEAAAGSSTLFTASSSVVISGGSIFQVSDSTVTGSSFLEFGDDFVLEDSDSKAVFVGLTSSSATRVVSGSGTIPTSTCSTCNVYGGSGSSTSSGNLDTLDKWKSNGVTVTVVVDGATGNVATGSTPNGPSSPAVGTCSDALCLSANTVAFGSAGSCACECKPDYNAPSCTTAEDLGNGVATECTVQNCLECDASGKCTTCVYGYTLSSDSTACDSTTPEQCAAPHCITCKAGTTNKCVQCEAGYLADDSGTCMAIPECVAPNCDECERLDGNTCKVCSSGSTMVSGQCKLCSDLMEGCAKCTSSVVCTECVESYNMQNGVCKRKFSGATASSPVTLALIALLASVLAAYAL